MKKYIVNNRNKGFIYLLMSFIALVVFPFYFGNSLSEFDYPQKRLLYFYFSPKVFLILHFWTLVYMYNPVKKTLLNSIVVIRVIEDIQWLKLVLKNTISLAVEYTIIWSLMTTSIYFIEFRVMNKDEIIQTILSSLVFFIGIVLFLLFYLLLTIYLKALVSFILLLLTILLDFTLYSFFNSKGFFLTWLNVFLDTSQVVFFIKVSYLILASSIIILFSIKKFNKLEFLGD